MNKQYKVYPIVGMLVVLAILVFAAGCTDTTTENITPTGKAVVKIGVIGPFSGDNAFLGEGMMNAAKLAQSQIPASSKYKYELIFEDDRLDPKLTASATQKLINIDRVDAIISISSGTGNVITPLAEQAKVIHFGIASDAVIAKGDYNFIHWTTPQAENTAFVAELERQGITKFGMIGMNQQGVMAIWDDLKDQLRSTDIEITEEQVYNLGEKDFKTMLLKVEESEPEIIMVLAFSPEIELIAKQAKELNIETPLTAIESFEYSEQPELFEGLWYIQAAEPQGKFSADYNTMFSEDPKVGAGNSYDIVNMIIHSYEATGATNQQKPARISVANNLLTIQNFDGALGSLSMDSEGIVDSAAVVKVLKGGKPTTLR